MTRKFSLPTLSLLTLSVAVASQQAVAAGLTINEQSISGGGMAFAGRASSALDASTVFGNPAGMSRLEGTNLSVGAAYIDASVDIKNATSGYPVPGQTNNGDMVPGTAVPFAYYTDQLNDRWHVGLGLYAPVGGKGDYERTFMGRFKGNKTEVTAVTFQPTLSYRAADNLSVGVGLMISKIEGTLNTNLLLGPGTEGEYKASGDDIGYGYNIGVLWDITDQTRAGLTYRSKIEHDLKGEVELVGIPAIAGKYRAHLDFTQPEAAELSFSHAFNERWTVHAGAVWTRWSRLKEIRVFSTAPAQFAERDEQTQWRDNWAFAIGTSYQVSPAIVLRTGFAVDESPVTNEHRSVRTPYGNRKFATVGLGWNVSDNLDLDFAYGYLFESDASVNQPVDATGARPAYSATFENTAHIFGAQLNYKF